MSTVSISQKSSASVMDRSDSSSPNEEAVAREKRRDENMDLMLRHFKRYLDQQQAAKVKGGGVREPPTDR